MEVQNKKCSLKKHEDIDAISYCQECKKYLCNKCQNLHKELFDDHKIIDLKKINEEFIDLCKEEGHNAKLEFYCKNHNILCCSACNSKIKKGGYGQHHDCDVFHINDIKDEKRNKLTENMKQLKELNNQIDNSIKELKIIFGEMDKNK